jgi:hypothetical protein
MRQEYKLSLRKAKIDDFIMRKREKAIGRNEEGIKLEINVDKLNLSSEVINKQFTNLVIF